MDVVQINGKAAVIDTARCRTYDAVAHEAREASLQRLLATAIGRPVDLDLEIGRHCVCGAADHGKPRVLTDRTVDFSISRSRCAWAIAVSSQSAVGVDVEDAPIDEDSFDIFLTPVEATRVAGVKDARRLWSRKEAVLKGIGVGLVVDPRRLDVLADIPVSRSRTLAAAIQGWGVQDFTSSCGVTVSIALGPPPDARVLRRLLAECS